MTALEEKDFIHEEYSLNPSPFWSWLAAVMIFSLLFFGASLLYFSSLAKQYANNPFLQVTNREMSLFLWQNPQHMRIHVKSKNSYLPAFQFAEKIGLNPTYAEDYVIAPPELLFLYHTWKRLIGAVYFPRKIMEKEFLLFLSAVPEWDPYYWKEAPKNYVELINTLKNRTSENIDLKNYVLPLEVCQAFVGWKNYFFEGEAINALNPSYKELSEFLTQYPQYQRHFWCNIVGESYLKNLDPVSEALVPPSELSSFLRVAYYNYIHQSH